MTERKAAEEAAGQQAKPEPSKGLPRTEWYSDIVSITPLPPGSPSQWHTLSHNLGSTNLLVDATLGDTNA